MSTPPDANEWVKRLSFPGSVLLEPFTADSTRSDGKQLILVSLVTLLLMIDLLRVTEGSVGVLKVEPSHYFNALAVMALTCLYFLLTYWITLFRDWKASYYKRLPAVVEQHRLNEELAIAQRERLKRNEHLNAEIGRLIAIRRAKLEEIHQTAHRPHPSSDEELEEFEKFLADFHVRQQELEAFEAYCKLDGLDALQAEHFRLAFDTTQLARSEALLDVLKTTNRLDGYRFIIDVIFPSALCLSAISASIYRLSH